MVLALGVGLMVTLKATRKKPKKKKRRAAGLLVQVIQAEKVDRRVVLKGHGQVQARREVSIVPQVSGKIIAAHPQLVAGGLIRRGEVMLRIDPADYRLATERAGAAVAAAQQKLAVEESSARVAREEWKLLGSQVAKGKPSPLTLREPQLKAARAGLASARADLKVTRLNLSRTTLRAPFNLRIRRESVEVGQYVAATREVASAFGTDRAEVVVPVKAGDLRWLDMPRRQGKGKGKSSTAVTVHQDTGTGAVQREATLVRSLGEIDSTSRLSRVVVSVTDPYNLKSAGQDRPPLEVGAFVKVTLTGKQLRDVVAIPSEALRIGAVVYIATAKDQLQVRKVTVARLTDREALISAGLAAGDRIIVTAISGAVDGMKLRVKAQGSAKQEGKVARQPGAARADAPPRARAEAAPTAPTKAGGRTATQ